MKTLIKNGLVFDGCDGEIHPLDLLCDHGIIIKKGARGSIVERDAKVMDADGFVLLPGLIDVHTHGRAGYDFVSLPEDAALHTIAADYARHGVTTVMPTLASAPLENMLEATGNIGAFEPNAGEATFCGVHIEGRYLNPEKKGAHALELLAPLDPKELDDSRLQTLDALHISAAFELDVNGEFAHKALGMGATLGLGHTAATYDEAIAAEKMGVTSYTHLFNAMPPLHHRESGAACACLTGNGYAEIICDGIHICPPMIKLAYNAKGKKRICLISDSMEATGCADGEYSIAGNPVTVKNGKALTHEGALAGSTLSLDEAVRNLCDFCGIEIKDAIVCATEAPAREVNIFDTCGSLDVGKRADMLWLTEESYKKNNFKIEKICLAADFK